MIEHLKIILLHFEHIIEHRARSFVWFLLALINPLILILFWRGASQENIASQISLPELTAYYFFLIFGVTFLMAHVEEDVAYYDIKQGNLVRYLLRPISYYWIKFYEENPVGVTLPKSIICVVVETENSIKGDTATNAMKNAILDTGAKVLVPLFIKVGDEISISTESGTYLSRK